MKRFLLIVFTAVFLIAGAYQINELICCGAERLLVEVSEGADRLQAYIGTSDFPRSTKAVSPAPTGSPPSLLSLSPSPSPSPSPVPTLPPSPPPAPPSPSPAPPSPSPDLCFSCEGSGECWRCDGVGIIFGGPLGPMSGYGMDTLMDRVCYDCKGSGVCRFCGE